MSKSYAEQRLTLTDKRKVEPSADDLRRIERETARINQALRRFSERSDVVTDFLWPAAGPTSSPFGLRRFFNAQPRNPHSGLDIAAPEGAPVRAPAAGRVVDTGRCDCLRKRTVRGFEVRGFRKAGNLESRIFSLPAIPLSRSPITPIEPRTANLVPLEPTTYDLQPTALNALRYHCAVNVRHRDGRNWRHGSTVHAAIHHGRRVPRDG